MKFSKYKIDEFYLIVICGFLTTTIFCINLKQNKDTVTDQGPNRKEQLDISLVRLRVFVVYTYFFIDNANFRIREGRIIHQRRNVECTLMIGKLLLTGKAHMML